MNDPLAALGFAAVAAVLVAAVVWPGHGLLARVRAAATAARRVRVEDALKHLYDCETRGHPCTVQSLGGALRLSGNRSAELVARLQHMELVEPGAGSYRLTSEGRSYALRVVRIHRLWERWLSDQTGLRPADWHSVAERREHRTSPEQAEAMAARMGHPRFDPHGDPIPTASGEVVEVPGIPLLDLGTGKVAEIVHVEDEPPAVYAQLLAEGLHPGMQVRLLESGPDRVRFEADAEEHVLAPIVAANLTVVPFPEEQEIAGPFERLSGLAPGQRARVTRIAPACRGPQRRRLLDLGIIPGTVVEAEMRSPGGDPTAYRVRGALIALRREQADLIQVDRLAPGGTS